MRPRATRFHGHPDDWPDDEWEMWKRRRRNRIPTHTQGLDDTRGDEPGFYGHPDDWTEEEWAAWKRLPPTPASPVRTEPAPSSVRRSSWWSRLRSALTRG